MKLYAGVDSELTGVLLAAITTRVPDKLLARSPRSVEIAYQFTRGVYTYQRSVARVRARTREINAAACV